MEQILSFIVGVAMVMVFITVFFRTGGLFFRPLMALLVIYVLLAFIDQSLHAR